MTNNTFMLPAEWECRSAVLLSWPHKATDWNYMLEEVTSCYINIARAISRVAMLVIVAPDISEVANELKGYVDLSRVRLIEMPTDDTWARDFGMICTKGPMGNWSANDFKFNGWGLKFRSCNDNLINRNIFKSEILNNIQYVNRLNFVLEGGSIDIDEEGTLLTTSECLLSTNRNGASTQDEIERTLRDTLGCKKVIWLNHGALEGDDTDSHIDTLARMLPGKIIAYTSCDRCDDSHYEDLKAMEAELQSSTDVDGHQFNLLPLPIPQPIYDEDNQRLPATYANFLIINGSVFLPIYGDTKYDNIAIDHIRTALPNYNIVPIDCRALIQQHGSLHCITMQLPEEIIK